MKALIVDDSNIVRVSMSRILSNLGIESLQATNGKEAIEVFFNNKEDINIILLDWNMPIMNGYDFLVEIRKKYHKSPKIMMVTTETEISSMLKALAAGADEYVMKPFNEEIIKGKFDILNIETSGK